MLSALLEVDADGADLDRMAGAVHTRVPHLRVALLFYFIFMSCLMSVRGPYIVIAHRAQVRNTRRMCRCGPP